MQEITRQRLLHAAVDRAPVGMAIFDPDLRYLHVNAVLAELNELPIADHLGRHVSEVVPPHIAGRLEPVLREVLESGVPRHGVDFHGGAPGAPRTWEGSIFPIGANGHAAGIGVTLLETTERDRALARARYLARASAALGSSLALDETLRTVAELAVPEVADWAFVELVQGDGSIKRVAWAHADPELADVVREYDARYPLNPDDPEGSAKVVRTGRPELLEELPADLFEAIATDPEQLRILRGMGFRSTVIVPLIARGRVLGDLALAYSTSGRRYGVDDLDMLSALADACALAIDNARLFGEQERTARTLQQSLLPPQLPEIAGVELAARYRPFGTGAEVGGDFYDVFPVPGGWALAIGDVAGKGTSAAATTALLRHTLRVAAYVEHAPGEALWRLNEAVLREGDEEHLATAVCAFLRPGDGRAEVSLASAGHPSPLVRRADGKVETVTTPGLLLGVAPADAPPESTVVLGPGDVLVLFTDGVTEARDTHGRLLGEFGLAETLRSAPPTANGVVDAVDRRALEIQLGHARDDIAVVAIAVPRT
jgi:serine phosphatase RsbU (regulator of sigma subunit)